MVELDIGLLKDYKLTPNQFVIAYLLYKNSYTSYRKLRSLLGTESTNELLTQLEEKGFINIGDNNPSPYTDIELDKINRRNKLTFMLSEGDYFDEIVDEYPTKVIRPDGTKDYLRSDLTRCRKLYEKITGGSKKKHERILEALKFEKQIRDKENSWKYMKKLPKWLSSEEWLIYQERMEDEGNKPSEGILGYGQQLK